MQNFERKEPELKWREEVKAQLLKRHTKVTLAVFFLENEFVSYSCVNKTLLDSIGVNGIDDLVQRTKLLKLLINSLYNYNYLL